MSSVGGTSGPISASAIVATVVGSGSHILRIEGYSATKGIGKGSYIASEAFVVCGRNWRLRYYPDSVNFRRACDSISIALVYDDVEEVEAKFTISLLDQAGIPVPSYSHTCTAVTYKQYVGFQAFEIIERSKLEGSAYLKDDAFSVRCDVTVVKKVFTKTITVSEAIHGVVKQER